MPRAREVIAYDMPAYKAGNTTIVHFAGWKAHYSLYAATRSVVAAFEAELKPYRIEKGTIRFPFSRPVPVKLIERIVAFRAGELVRATRDRTP